MPNNESTFVANTANNILKNTFKYSLIWSKIGNSQDVIDIRNGIK